MVCSQYSGIFTPLDQLSGIKSLQAGLRQPEETWYASGKREMSSFQAISGYSRTNVLIASFRFWTGAHVCGSQGMKIFTRVFEGLLLQFPPGSRTASSAK